MVIRDCTPEDYTEVLTLNSRSTPMVNEISLQELEDLAKMSNYFRIVVDKQEIIGVLLVLPPKQPYASLNYQWFDSRYQNFCYIDRVFIRAEYIGKGIGKQLYQDLLAHQIINDSIKYLCCEVNIKPMNKPSLLFHHKLGFESVGERDSTQDKKVSLLLKKITADKEI
jgi:hypothetical protein